MFYFTISPYLKDNNDKNYLILNDLNEKIIKLTEDINGINYNDIAIFLQKNKFDANNSKIDAIIKEQDKKKRAYNKSNSMIL